MRTFLPNTIGKNIVHLLYSTALSSVLNAMALIYLASYMQSHYYGMFSVSLAVAMIMGYLTDAGLTEIALREGARKGAQLEAVVSSYIKIRILLLLITFIGGYFFIHQFHAHNQELLMTTVYLAIPLVAGLAMQGVGNMFFQLIEKMQYIGFIKMTSSSLLVGSLVIGTTLHLTPLTICFLYGMSYFAAGIIAIVMVSKRIPIQFSRPFQIGFLKNFGAFSLSGLLFILSPHLGPLVLEKTLTLKEVGLFAVAYRIPQALMQIPFVVAGAFRPVLFRHHQHNQPEEHTFHHIRLVKVMALFGIVMTIPLYYFSEEIIGLLFSDHWLSASNALKILSLLLTLQAFNIALADGLTTTGRQTFRTIIQLLSVSLGVLAYVVWSRSDGIMGAAYAGIVIEMVALIGFWVFLPNRREIANRSLIPYFCFFIGSFGVITHFLESSPYVAAIVQITCCSLLLAVDSDLRTKLISFIQTFRTKTINHKKGVEDAVQ
ncbi:oligosaccharide flippase family protein [Fictibacillus nanhaiensis]|uniref:lipopolysaccharide biosynthesis protein n=1 Tax=Fictibacillus nanhaiensis TaxID=742169 RepID=UPI001C95CB36|nr:oligosaccharide flippase family protein [Fictibacillus nanhaiensis]MBY6037223.1 oligosaccharide flippase family protein [Fictibacillus nanhaiensis]